MPENLEIYTDRKVYSIPEGLNELMYDISKEVLRCQPKNLYKFISDYLITLLKVREAVKVAVPLIESEFVEAESQTNFLKKYNISKEQGDRFATVIQAAYRGYRLRKKLLHIVDTYVKDETNMTELVSEEAFFADPIFEFLKTRGVSPAKTVEAATKIQAYFRGYQVRKMERDKGIECLVHGVPSHESWRHDWLDQTIRKSESSHDEFPWRKSFADFHKNYTRRNEDDGDRLHMETIFGGRYEDYNLICDQTSCQEFIVPTVSEAKELATPGEIESDYSEELGVPGREIMEELMAAKIKETSISYEEADKEEMFFKVVTEKRISATSGAGTTELVESLSVHTAKSKTSVEDRKSIVSSVKSEGSKGKGSKKSAGTKSQKSEHSVASFVPELSVRSLSVEGQEAEGEMSQANEDTVSATVSAISEVSGVPEGEGSHGSKKSTTISQDQVSAVVSVAEDEEKKSRGSKKSGGTVSRKSGSNKSAVEAAPEE